jgi:hypothetical protein
MPQWYDITRSEDYQALSPEEKSQAKTFFFQKNILPNLQGDVELNDDKVIQFAFDEFMAIPDDTGQGYVTSMLGAAGRGFAGVVPGAVTGAGALLGSETIQGAGESLQEGLESIAPVNPLYEDDIAMKGANVLGNVGGIITTGGIGGALGKGLAAERIAAAGTQAARQALTAQAIQRGASSALYGTGFAQGAAQKAQENERLGMEGPEAYLNLIGGGLSEVLPERFGFGTALETSAARRLLGGVDDAAGKVIPGIRMGFAQETLEGGSTQALSNLSTQLTAPQGVETPGLFEGVGEAALWEGVGGAMFGAINKLGRTPPDKQTPEQQQWQSEINATPVDSTPPVTPEESQKNASEGGIPVVTPDGVVSWLPAVSQAINIQGPQPEGMPSDVEQRLSGLMGKPTDPGIVAAENLVAATVDNPDAQDAAATAAAIIAQNKKVADSMPPPPSEPAVQSVEEVEEAGPEVTPEMPVLEEIPVEETPSLPETGPPVVDQEAPAVTTVQAAPIQPTAPQENAPLEIIDTKSLRQEPQDRVESREEKESSIGNILLDSANSQEEEKLIRDRNSSVRGAYSSVFSNINNLKVADSIISNLPVNVVNLFGGKEGASQVLLHNPTVLQDTLTIYGDSNIPMLSGDSRMLAVARLRAKLLSFEPAGRNTKLLTALKALDDNLLKIVRLSTNGGSQLEGQTNIPSSDIGASFGTKAGTFPPVKGDIKSGVANSTSFSNPAMDSDIGHAGIFSSKYPKSSTSSSKKEKSIQPITPQAKPTPATEGMVMPGGSAMERDVTKPEQMTPEEYLTPRIAKLEAEIAELEANQPNVNSKAYLYWQPRLTEAKRNLKALKEDRDEPGTDKPWAPGLQQRFIFEALDANEPVSASAVDAYGITLPEGYVKQRDLYVFQPGATGEPVQAAPSAAQAAKATAPGPIQKPVTQGQIQAKIQELLRAPTKGTKKPAVSFKTQTEENAFARGFQAATERQGEPPPARMPNRSPKDQKWDDAWYKGWASGQTFVRSLPSIPSTGQLPQTTTVATQNETAAPLAEGAAVAGVGSNLTGGRSSELPPSETQETQPSTKEIPVAERDADSIIGALDVMRNQFRDQAKVKRTLDDEVGRLPKAKLKEVADALGVKATKDEVVASIMSEPTRTEKVMADIYGKEEEEAEQRESFKEERKRARDSITAKDKPLDERPEVTGQDVAFAKQLVQEEVPAATFATVMTAEEFLASESLTTAFRDIAAGLRAGRIEGVFISSGHVFLFPENIIARQSDIKAAEELGIPVSVAAARRVILHESLVHFGFAGLTENEQNWLIDWAKRNSTETDIAEVLRKYPRESNEDQATHMLRAFEERLAAIIEKTGKWPTTSAWQELKAFLRRLWNRIMGVADAKPTDKELLNVLRMLQSGSERMLEKSFAKTGLGGNVRLTNKPSYAGEKAEMPQFMRDSLDTAKAMAAAGKDSEEIRAVTGWFPGKYDGKMRWELPDEGASIKAPAVLQRLSQELDQAKQEFQAAKNNGGFDNPNFYSSQIKVANIDRKIESELNKSVGLSEVLTHDVLFEAYPELSNVSVRYELRLTGKGQFDRAGNEIVINERLRNSEDGLSVLLHEVQHWIQEREGFARGGDSRMAFADPRMGLGSKEGIRAATKILNRILGDMRKPLSIEEFAKSAWQSDVVTSEIEESYKDYLKTTKKASLDYNLEKLAQETAAKEWYKNLAGEIEARDVQARQKLTPEQRRATAPYSSENIAKEDAIVMFGGGTQASYSTADEARLAELYQNLTPELPNPAVREAYDRLATTQTQVAISDLRNESGLSKEDFAQSLQTLFDNGQAVLSPASSIEQQEADAAEYGVFGHGGTPASFVTVMPETAKFSLADTSRDAEYLAAVEAGDMEKVQEFVDKAAGRFASMEEIDPREFQYSDEDDPFFYHVTDKERLEQIVYEGEGLRPGSQGQFAGAAAQANSRGKVFFTERSGVKVWMGEVERQLESSRDYDEDASVEDDLAVIRIPKHLVQGKQDDDPRNSPVRVGRDFFTTQPIPAFPEAVVRDDEGNVIPPSQRFQPKSPDIRLSLNSAQEESENESAQKAEEKIKSIGAQVAELQAKAKQAPWQGAKIPVDMVLANHPAMTNEVRGEIMELARKIIASKLAAGIPYEELATDVTKPSFIGKVTQNNEFFAEPMRQALLTEVGLVMHTEAQRLAAEGKPLEADILLSNYQSVMQAAANKSSVGSNVLRMRQGVINHPDYGPLHIANNIRALQAEERRKTVGTNAPGLADEVKNIQFTTDQAAKDVADAVEDIQERSDEEFAMEAMSDEVKSRWSRAKALIAKMGAIARNLVKRGVKGFKASKAASAASDDLDKFSVEELQSEFKKAQSELNGILKSILGEEAAPAKGTRKPKKTPAQILAIRTALFNSMAKEGLPVDLETAVAGIAPVRRTMWDTMVERISKGVGSKVESIERKPEDKQLLNDLTNQLTRVLRDSVQGEKKEAPKESLGLRALRAFGYVASNDQLVREAWEAARENAVEVLADVKRAELGLPKLTEQLAALESDLAEFTARKEGGSIAQQKAADAKIEATQEQIKDVKARIAAIEKQIKALRPEFVKRRDELMSEVPRQFFATSQARSIIREALEDKYDNTKELLDNVEEARQHVIDRLNEAVDKEGNVDPARWDRDSSFIKRAFDDMVADMRESLAKAEAKRIAAAREKLFSATEEEQIRIIQRKLNDLRPEEGGIKIPWDKLAQIRISEQKTLESQMFEALKADPAFAGLPDSDLAKLSKIVSKVWQKKRETVIAKELERIEARNDWSKKAKEAVKEHHPKIMRLINAGLFDDNALYALIAEEYGFKELTPEQQARAIAITEKFMDPKTPRYVRAALQKEFKDIMMEVRGPTLLQTLNAVWYSSVLSSMRTMATIALSVLNNGLTFIGEAVATVIANPTNPSKWIPILDSIDAIAKNLGPAAVDMWKYLKTGDSVYLDSNILNDPFYADQIKKGVALDGVDVGERMYRTAKNPVTKAIGWHVMVITRLLRVLDGFNARLGKVSSMPFMYRRLTDEYDSSVVRALTDPAHYREKLIQDGVDPNSPALSALAMHAMHEDWDSQKGLLSNLEQNTNYNAAWSAMTGDPKGAGGVLYGSVKMIERFMGTVADTFEKAIDQRLEMMGKQGVEKDPLEDFIVRRLGKPSSYFLNYLASNLLPGFGLGFVRVVGNSLNQAISLIPFVGMLRVMEGQDPRQKVAHRALLMRNQAFGIIGLMVMVKALKDIEDEPDDEKRGWFVEGNWEGLTPQQKAALFASGAQPNSIGYYKNGKRINIRYSEWPLASLFSLTGNLSDNSKYRPESWQTASAGSKAAKAVYYMWSSAFTMPAISQAMENLGAPRGSEDPFEAAERRIPKALASFAGGYIPRSIKDLDMWMQSETNRYKGWESLAKEIPFVRRAVGTEYLDVFGKQLETDRAPWSRVFTEGPDDPAYQLLGRLSAKGVWLSPPNPNGKLVGEGSKRREMTPDEGVMYQKEVGKGYRQLVLRYGNRLLQMPEERAKKFASQKAEEVREKVTAKIDRIVR